MNTLTKFLKGFTYAFSGLIYCVKSCRNFRFHMVAGTFVLYFSRFFDIDKTSLAVIISLIGTVLCAEAFNCALEKTCDAVTEKEKKKKKKAKDAAAAAVLILAVTAVVIAILYFLNADGFVNAYRYISASVSRIIIFFGVCIVSVIFVFCERIFKNGK